MNERIYKIREYLNYIQEHYNNVQNAWELIQRKCKDKNFKWLTDLAMFHALDLEIKNHDISKLSAEEFVPYRKKFFGTEEEKKTERILLDFDQAWEHHKLNNRHHWENWTKQPDNSIIDLVHNICDWMAMGMKFKDSARDYYEKNKDEIILPEWAVVTMNEIFDLVYGKVKHYNFIKYERNKKII